MGGVGSGGHARSGPPPDPQALRRDRGSKGDEWITLPLTGLSEVPSWPLTEQNEREETFWHRLWTERPQAHEWLRLGLDIEVALYCRKLSEAEKPKSSTILAQTIRQLSDSLGLSIGGMQRNRWKIPVTQATEPAARTTPRRRAPSSRDRLKVVPPPN